MVEGLAFQIGITSVSCALQDLVCGWDGVAIDYNAQFSQNQRQRLAGNKSQLEAGDGVGPRYLPLTAFLDTCLLLTPVLIQSCLGAISSSFKAKRVLGHSTQSLT